jgi:hypothetical protein
VVGATGGTDDIREGAATAEWRCWVGPLLLIGTGAAMVWWTWGAWPDPLVDFGRELYVPWRLAQGDRLFTDIAWFSGPLSQHWNALLFRTFGPGLSVLVWSNIVVLVACTGMLYGLITRLSDRLAATVAAMVFLLVFAFGQYVGIANYNWITPYSHEVTHGVALSLAALVALERWLRTGSIPSVALGGLALGLCFLTKVETFLAGATASVVMLAPAVRARDGRSLAAFTGAALAPIVASILFLGLRGTLGGWPSVLAGEVAELAFYRADMGLDRPGARIAEMLTWSGIWVAAFALPVAASWLGRDTSGPVLPLAVGALGLLALAALGGGIPWPDALRPLPLATVVAGVGLVMGARKGSWPPRTVAGLAFAALGLVLLLKILLRARVAHYGFALAMPASLLLVTTSLGWLPRWLDGRGFRGDVVRAYALALLAVFAVEHLSTTSAWLSTKTAVVGTGRDAFRSDARGVFVKEAVAYLASSDAGSVVVLPEGVQINYLARVPNPTPFVNFMPPEEIIFGDDRWVEALRRAPPDIILIVPKDTSEYGRGSFGEGYGRSLAAWVASEYVREGAIRVDGIAFEIVILVRREPPSPGDP